MSGPRTVLTRLYSPYRRDPPRSKQWEMRGEVTLLLVRKRAAPSREQEHSEQGTAGTRDGRGPVSTTTALEKRSWPERSTNNAGRRPIFPLRSSPRHRGLSLLVPPQPQPPQQEAVPPPPLPCCAHRSSYRRPRGHSADASSPLPGRTPCSARRSQYKHRSSSSPSRKPWSRRMKALSSKIPAAASERATISSWPYKSRFGRHF